ncbi:hypothetical protein P5673_002376 [Acropora cervicornis]|uniref:Uncharacterized protein n=1 Tax=Acropora cervicornis TaxID=6130 RepID=A0AAD9R3P3_ACRCE|nr:hypothetical protein P5673_002376 [Acropora cervicornis]
MCYLPVVGLWAHALKETKEAYGFSNSHLGGSLGKELETLVTNDVEGWKQLQDNLRGRACLTALKNFLGPLRVLLRSESTSDHVCQYSGKKLNETMDELVKVIRTTVVTIRRYVSHHSHVNLRGSAKVQHINMTRMTDLAARQMHSQNHHTPVSLRNFVLLELLERAMRNILSSRGCLNTARSLLTPCPVGDN